VLGGLAALFAANAQFGTEPAKLSLVKVRDDVYVIRNPFVPGNTTAVITAEGVILVDDKFEIDHDNVVAMLKTVTNQPVKHVINTDYHADHSGGNAKLQAAGTLGVASLRHANAWSKVNNYAGGGSAKEWTATVEES
jgi:cyclase